MKKWLLLLGMIFSVTQLLGQEYSYLPTANVHDAKMFEIISTGATGDIGTELLEFRLEVSQTWPSLRLGVYDGDISANNQGHWDARGVNITPPPTLFIVYADPNGDATDMVLKGTWNSTMMVDDAWYDCVVPLGPEARNRTGTYIYRLQVTTNNPHFSQFYANRFKLRVNGKLEIHLNTFEFVGGLQSITDIPYIYPQSQLTPPYGPFEPTTYDGTFQWFFYLPRPVSYIEFWDGEFDYGQASLSLPHDTDDPNTPNNVLPPWGYLGDETLPEGVRLAGPIDDSASPIYRRPPNVFYELVAPDGAVYRNENPSGNREWERFRVDTAPFDPTIMDYHADELPAGIYQVNIYGVDLGNSKNMRFFNTISGVSEEGEPIINVPVPPEHLGSIGDWVWEDSNHNGFQDMGEEGLAHVTLRLVNDLGFQISKTMTDENGSYLFKNVPAGRFTILLDGATIPWGLQNTTFNLPYSISLDKGERHREADFGYTPLEGNGCREVLAWYDPWYGSASSADPLRHWSDQNQGGIADTAAFDLYVPSHQNADINPLFDSTDPDMWEHDILLAWAAHVDAFVVNWFGKDSYEQSGLKGLLDTAERLYQQYGASGFDFRIIVAYHEEALGDLDDNLAFLADSVFTHPAYYHQREGLPRPLYVYTPQHSLAAQDFMTALHNACPEKIVVCWNWEPGYIEPAGLVDSVYPWPLHEKANWDDQSGMKWGEEYLDEFYATAADLDVRFLTAGVWPGYDDRLYIDGINRWMQRLDGRVYTATWDKLNAAFPPWVLIHSWNDFNHATQVQNTYDYTDLYVRLTQSRARAWKYANGCADAGGERDITVPELVLNARKLGATEEEIAALISEFISRGQIQVQAPQLAMAAPVAANALVFVKGSPSHFGQSWENAVDGDREGWDGTATVKPKGSDYSKDAWAIFRFGDGETYQFDYLTMQTDNGKEDDRYPERQAKVVDVYVSTAGQDESDFQFLTRLKIKVGAEKKYGLPGRTRAKYIKLVVVEPKWTSGGWRQIVEFGVHCLDQRGAKPASETVMLAAVPQEFGLGQNYPNPFNPVTTIPYQLPNAGHVTLKIYDMLGHEVATLVDGEQAAGWYQVEWSAQQMASGTYFCRLTAGAQQSVRKLVVMK